MCVEGMGEGEGEEDEMREGTGMGAGMARKKGSGREDSVDRSDDADEVGRGADSDGKGQWMRENGMSSASQGGDGLRGDRINVDGGDGNGQWGNGTHLTRTGMI